MGRVYSARVSGVSVAAVQDLMSLLPGVKAIAVHEVVIGQVTGTTVNNLPITLKRLSGTLTAGSGGTAVTPQKMDTGGIAAVTTARANDTTSASATTSTILRNEVYNSVNTYQYLPPPEDRPIIGPGEQFVLTLDNAPASAQVSSITVTFEELF